MKCVLEAYAPFDRALLKEVERSREKAGTHVAPISVSITPSPLPPPIYPSTRKVKQMQFLMCFQIQRSSSMAFSSSSNAISASVLVGCETTASTSNV